jgi:hypothetical protein
VAAVSDDFYYRPPGPKRAPRPRPLSAQAQARLDTMSSELPQPGDEITIRWPGGPHDFVMHFRREGDPAPWPGWHYLHGSIVEPANWHPNPWSPLAHLVDGEWTMVPKDGRVTEED